MMDENRLSIIFFIVGYFVSTSVHQQLSVNFAPNESNCTRVLLGTNITFNITLNSNNSLIHTDNNNSHNNSNSTNNNLLVLFMYVNKTLHMNSTKYILLQKIQFACIGEVLIEVKSSLAGNESWSQAFGVVNAKTNDIQILPNISGNVESGVELSISLTVPNCLIYNKDSNLWEVDGNSYSGLSFTHKFGKSGNASTEELIIFGYESYSYSGQSITRKNGNSGNAPKKKFIEFGNESSSTRLHRLIRVYDRINNFEVHLNNSVGCVNDFLSVSFSVHEGSDVNFETQQRASVTQNQGSIKFNKSGEYIVSFSASNVINNQSVSKMFHIVDNIQISTNFSEDFTILTSEVIENSIKTNLLEPNNRWYYKSIDTTDWIFLNSGQKLSHSFDTSGTYQILGTIGDENSICQQVFQVNVKSPETPRITFLPSNTMHEPGDIMTIKVDIYENHEIAILEWRHDGQVIEECTEEIPVKVYQQYTCNLMLSNNSLIMPSYKLDPLSVKIQGTHNASYSYMNSIKPISTFTIKPPVIQVRDSVNLWISTYNSSFYCFKWNDYLQESLQECKFKPKFYKNETGDYFVAVTVFNAINSLAGGSTITVVDVKRFNLVESIGITDNKTDLAVFAGEVILLQIENSTNSTIYTWTISPTDDMVRLTPNPSKSCRYYFNKTADKDEHDISVQRYELVINARLYYGFSYDKIFEIQVFKEFQNITYTIETFSILANKENKFNVSWLGSPAMCSANESLNSIKNLSVIQNHTYCTVSFSAPSSPQNFTIRLVIENQVQTLKKYLNFTVYQIFDDISIISPEKIATGKEFWFSILEDIPGTHFQWVISNQTHAFLFNHTQMNGTVSNKYGNNSFYNTSFNSTGSRNTTTYNNTYSNTTKTNQTIMVDQVMEEYYVRLGMGEGRNITFKVPSNFLIGYYNITVIATGHLLTNGSITKTMKIRVAAGDIYLWLSSDFFMKTTEFIGMNVTVSHETDLRDSLLIWYLLEPTLYEDDILRELARNKSQISHSIFNESVEGEYIFKLRAMGDWIFGECLIEGAQDTFVQDCVEKNITFLLCDTAQPLVAFSQKRELVRSLWFYSKVTVRTTCLVRYTWLIQCNQLDNETCNGTNSYTPKTIPGISPILNSPSLELPPLSFEPGFYTLTCVLTIKGQALKPDLNISVNVTRSQLIPLIKGYRQQTVGRTNNLTLDATGTIDPDSITKESSLYYFRWLIHNSSSILPCLLATDQEQFSDVAKWSPYNSVIGFRENCLNVSSINATVFVRRDLSDKTETNTTSFTQLIKVVNNFLVSVDLVCHTCQVHKSLKYSRNQQSKFTARCINCRQDEGNLSYVWTVKGLTDNMEVELNESNVLSLLNSSTFVLAPLVFDGLQEYMISVNVISKELNATGSSMFTYKPNFSPENGSCKISPNTGEALKTYFRITCHGWQDEDNTKVPFIYWIIVNSNNTAFKRKIISRSITEETDTLLPPGDEQENWKLKILIEIEDLFGARTEYILRSVVVERKELFPSRFIMKIYTTSVKGKDLNKATGTANSVASLMSSLEDYEKEEFLNKFIDGTAELQASSLETTSQILQAFSSIDTNTSVRTIQRGARNSMFKSLGNLLELSKAFSKTGKILHETSQNYFVYLLSRNLDYGDVGSKFNGVDGNYVYIQEFFNLILSNKISGEISQYFNTDTLSASIQRSSGISLQVEENGNLGGCSVSYNLPELQDNKDLFKIVECTENNPFDQNLPVKSPIFSLTFKKNETEEMVLKDLVNPLLFNISTFDLELQELATVTLQFGRLFTKALTNIQPPDGRRWENSALHVVVDILEAVGTSNVYVHLSHGSEPISMDKQTIVRVIDENSHLSSRSLFINGSDYEKDDEYYLGLQHNDFGGIVKVEITVFSTSCLYWDVHQKKWLGEGCRPTNTSTQQNTVCECNHLTSFSSQIQIVPQKIDFSVLKELDIDENPVALVTLLVVIFIYLVLVLWSRHKDLIDATEEHVIPFIGSPEGFYQYEIRIKTGIYPFSGTTSKVAIQLFGTRCVTKVRVLKTDTSFQRNSLDIFRLGLDQNIGKIHKIRIWHDNSGYDPTWYLERVVVRNLFNGAKYFFFCNKWVGTEYDGNLDCQFYVASKDDIQRFTTIFFDTLIRGFNDLHMWLSFFERPKFSKFSRVQRATCLFTLLLSWMAVNAMWFQSSKTTNQVFNVGWASISLEEIVIGFVTALMVFPLNIFFYIIFRKSRQRKIPKKPLKIWERPRRVEMEFVNLDKVPLLSEDNESDDSDGENDITRMRRAKKCPNVHRLLTVEERHQFMGSPVLHHHDATIINSNTTFTDSPSTLYKTLRLPHSFATDNNYQPGNQETLKKENMSTVDAVTVFEQWKLQHLDFLRDKCRFNSPSKVNDHAKSCEKLPREDANTDGNKDRKTHSADSIRRLIIEEELSKTEEMEVGEEIMEFGSEVEMHDINEHFPAFGISQIGERNSLEANDEKEIKLSKQIKRNESLAKRLKIPEIIELDLTTHRMLPYWFVYIGYACCFSVSLFSGIVVLTYGQQFGYTLAMKWLKSLFFGFVEDFLLCYPVILLIIALVNALLIKPDDLDAIDHVDFLICETEQTKSAVIQNIGHPLEGEDLERAKEEAQRRTKRRNYVKTVLQQIMILLMLSAAFFTTFNSTREIRYTQDLKFRKELMTSLEPPKQYNVGKNTIIYYNWQNYWLWLETTLLTMFYNRDTDAWILASVPTIHQIRKFKPTCLNGEYFKNTIHSCTYQDQQNKTNTSITMGNRIQGSLDKWQTHTVDLNFLSNSIAPGERFYEHINHNVHGPGGYQWVFQFFENTSQANMTKLAQRLKTTRWVDRNTESLMHQFTLHNDARNILAYINLNIYHSDAKGSYETVLEILYSPGQLHITGNDLLAFFCFLGVLIISMLTLWEDVKKVLKNWPNIKPTFWVIHLCIVNFALLVLLGMCIEHFVRRTNVKNLYQQSNDQVIDHSVIKHYGLQYRKLEQVFYFIVFMVIIRCVKLMTMRNMFDKYCLKLLKIWRPFLLVAAFHLIILTITSHVMVLIYHSSDWNFKTFEDAFLTLAFRWWSVENPNVSAAGDRSRSRFGNLINFVFTLYYIFFAFNIFRMFALSLKQNDEDSDESEGEAKKEVTFKSIIAFVWEVMLRQRKRKIRRVHFRNQVFATEYQVEKEEEDVKDGGIEMQEELPPLPFDLEELNGRLLSALEDLDDIIDIDGWECEFYSHYQKRFTRERFTSNHVRKKRSMTA